ncbi:MAG TPA: hypothetical protein VK501_02755 [Baekduia sp.]|uniref:hypothetical protein n=1 Tax=Baekduia sp. TaxID=2600305 RepID=UPI002B9444DC|nr:hypothetical protein [Baekduia sp.]HMJ32812.1 hypothetical protein [Baekduia sp.]
MTSRRHPIDDANATDIMEARLALRQSERRAESGARRLADRLADVELHQREARFMLERAGMLTRRPRGSAR